MKGDCTFCEIVAGRLPSRRVHEGDEIVVFRNQLDWFPVQLLVVPTRHMTQDAPMLILDDLGIERQSDWAYEKLYQLFVHRHDLRLSTVITTHINLIDVGGTGASLRVDTGRDASILSRMKDKTVVSLKPIDVPDFRPKKGGRRRG